MEQRTTAWLCVTIIGDALGLLALDDSWLCPGEGPGGSL